MSHLHTSLTELYYPRYLLCFLFRMVNSLIKVLEGKCSWHRLLDICINVNQRPAIELIDQLKNNHDLISTRKAWYFHSTKQICINTHCDCTFLNQSKQLSYENFIDQIITAHSNQSFRMLGKCSIDTRSTALDWNRYYFCGVLIDRNQKPKCFNAKYIFVQKLKIVLQ